MNFTFVKSRTFWTGALLTIYLFLTSVTQVFPNVAWVTGAVSVLGLILVTYFHVNPSQQYNPPQ